MRKHLKTKHKIELKRIMNVDLSTLEALILSKNLLGLRVGDSKEKILDVFGAYIDFAPQRKNNKAIISYGALQFYLLNQRLDGFTFDAQKIQFFEKRFVLEKIYFSELENFLLENKSPFSEDTRLSFQDSTTLIVEDGMYFCFVADVLTIFGFDSSGHR